MIKRIYLNYYEEKLLKANDVETQPGPRKNFKQSGSNHVHLTVLITLLILLINKVQQYSTAIKLESHNYQAESLLNISNLLRCKVRKQWTIPSISTSAATVSLLLIIAGDIHPNPGPVYDHSTSDQVSSATDSDTCEPTILTCDTCHSSFRLETVTGSPVRGNIRSTSFDWICTNTSCHPNHHHGDNNDVQSSPNRFNTLNATTTLPEVIRKKKINHSQDKKPKSPHRTVTPKPITTSTARDSTTNLLDELPQIDSIDYIGKDLCRECLKEIKAKQHAISCDRCDMWTHRGCSDMSVKTYNWLKKKKCFSRICDKCLVDDELIRDKADKTKLSEEHLPEPLEYICKSKDCLLIIHLNCRSLVNKEEELQHIIDELNPDIICLTETWFNDSIPAQAFVPDNYSIIRKDRSENFKQKYGRNRGGGVAVLHKKHIKVENKTYLTDKVEEILWVQVKTKYSFMLGTIYRTEYTDILINDKDESTLEENIRKASEITSNIIITGDLNVDMLDHESKETQALVDTFESYDLKQYIAKATRVDKKSLKPTILDHVWASPDSNLIKSTGTFDGISDHMGTYMKLNQKPPPIPDSKIIFRSYKNYNSEDFCSELAANIEASNIEDLIENNDVNSATEELVKVIQETAQKHAPVIEVKKKNQKKGIPWFTEELKSMIKNKNELLQDYYTSGLDFYKSRLKMVSNSINHLKRNLKKSYIQDKLEEANGDSKETWKIYNLITRRTKTKEATEPDMMNQQKADKFNRYFATVGLEIQRELEKTGHSTTEIPDTQSTQMPDVSDAHSQHSQDSQSQHDPDTRSHDSETHDTTTTFTFQKETIANIEKIIDNIRNDVAVGEDMIGAKLIKDMKNTISSILVKIINKGYETETFPDCMKRAAIKPIHKKDDIDDISNYRPISILPTLSKIFEKAATIQFVSHFETNKKIHRSQHAYRLLHSTITCLVEVTNYVYRLLDKKKLTAIISLDLSKAFDSINHKLLLNKLRKLGLNEAAVMWVKSYLSNRKQITKFRNFTSQEEAIFSGIPQGSIVGPFLFLCYTNDFHDEFEGECRTYAYADDTQLVIEATNIQQLQRKIESIMAKAQKWYQRNAMKNNIGKTEVLLITSNKKNEFLKIKVKDGSKVIIIKSKPHIKILGIIIDSKLNWRKQVNEVRRKSFNITRNIHHINHLLPLQNKLNLYHALISPQFSYGDVVWGGCGQKESLSLQRVQNFAAKSITGNRKYDSATASLKQLKLLNLKQRRNIHETVLVHKALQNKCPENINTQYQQHLSKVNTRQSTHRILQVPTHKTTKFEKSPLYRSIKSWNSVPNHINTEKIKLHKTQLQRHLIQQAYSSSPLS